MDKSSFIGLIVGVGGIIAGLLLEGGKISQILQPTAAMIVFGGTLGAVLLQFPLPVVAQPSAGWPGLLRAQAGSAADSTATDRLRQQGPPRRHRVAGLRPGTGIDDPS